MAVDLSAITGLLAQKQAIAQQLAVTADPTAKAILQAQANALDAQINAGITHAQAQVDATNSFLDQMNLWTTLQAAAPSVAGGITSIIALFQRH